MSEKEREFKFTDQHFETLRKLVREHTGIALSDVKRELVYGRLARRLRALDLRDFDAYLKMLKEGSNDELGNFVNSVTTNLTSFFRENHHFEHLKTSLLPYLLKSRDSTRRIRIWSAGCSTGQEPYSIAMVVRETVPHIENWDIKILATDIDTNVLNTGSEGVYQLDKIEGISDTRLRRFFLRNKQGTQESVKVRPELRELITFRQLNLLKEWPMSGKFDILFCRNVVIYFDKPTQRILFDRYANILADDGQMFIGHSESLFKVTDRFELLGRTIHRKCA